MSLEVFEAPGMTAIGETLRRERLRRALDLETISRELKISSRFLEAIEAEKFDRLSGGVFTKAFVRQYAHYLGVDEEEIVNEVDRMLHPATEAAPFAGGVRPDSHPIDLPRVEEWERVSDRRVEWGSWLPSLALVVVVMMACAGVYSFWQRSRHTSSTQERRPAAAASSNIQTAAAQATVPPVPAVATPEAPKPEPQPQAEPAKPAEPPASADRTAAQADAAAGNAPAAAAVTPAASTPAASVPGAPGPVHVELVASEPVWVLARSDGKYSFSGTIEANQPRIIDANSTVLLRVGNAGGVSITLNGKPIGAIGPKGQVRTVQLTPGGFEIVATPKTPADPLVN